MRRHSEIVRDVIRIKRYVAKHRRKDTRRVLRGLGVGGVFALIGSVMIELPWSSALVLFLFLGMATPGVLIHG